MLKIVLVMPILFVLFGCAENKIKKQQITHQAQDKNKPSLTIPKLGKDHSIKTSIVADTPQAIVAGAPQPNQPSYTYSATQFKGKSQVILAGAPQSHQPSRPLPPHNTIRM